EETRLWTAVHELTHVARAYGRPFPADAERQLILLYKDPPTTEIYTLSLHDALPILRAATPSRSTANSANVPMRSLSRRALERLRSEEHTSELQSRFDLVCRLLLEKKKWECVARINYS